MKEIVITPSRTEDLQIGTLVDDEGGRFVALAFSGPGDQPISVTMTVPLFEAYVEHMGNVVKAIRNPANWVSNK